jgi:hypothetical protein
LVIAKAERIDTTQLELEFATQLGCKRGGAESDGCGGGGSGR